MVSDAGLYVALASATTAHEIGGNLMSEQRLVGCFRSLVLLLAAGLISTTAAAQPKQITADFGSWLPSTHPQAVNSFEPWVKLVEEKTQGRVKITLHHGGALGTSKAVLNDVKGGAYQIGLLIPTYYYDTPLFEILIGELPFAISSPELGRRVMTEFLGKYDSGSLKKLKLKSMGILASDPYALFSTSPVRTVGDLKGLKVRTSKVWVPIVKAWGGVPTPMQPEEAYTALDRGTLDVMSYGTSGALSWKYFEVAPYVTRLVSPVTMLAMVMNQGFYDKLPSDLQKLFDEELNPALINMMVATYVKGEDEALKKMAQYFKDKGKGEVIDPTPSQMAGFIKPAKAEWASWVAEADKRGLPGEAMMADFKKILGKNGVELPF